LDEYEPASEAGSRKVLARSPRKSEIMEYSLMLASQGIRHWIEFDGDEYSVSLEEKDAAVAADLIELYRSENRGFQDQDPVPVDLDLNLSPLAFLAVPTVCYFLVGFDPAANWMHSRGNADAGLILSGEWWRCLTAATLHADDLHFMSNLVSGYFILNLLTHRLGMGTIMILATLGAGFTNYLVALASGGNHLSIGFSTVVFCALGMLAAVETFFNPRRGDRSLRRLTPLISAFFVAVMVGLGERADVKAHFYGFGIGAALGMLLGFASKAAGRPLTQAAGRPGARKAGPRAVQAFLAMTTYGLFAQAWRLALAQ